MLNKLHVDALEGGNRILAWLLILWGYFVSLGLAVDPRGFDDPVFNVVRKLPFTPYSWAALLAVSVTVYTTGELISERSRRRGALIITGAVLCSAWWLAMTLATSRMVYVMPDRITILWPIIVAFIFLLYGSRMVVYADAFIGDRWNTNPYQLWGTLGVMTVSLSQVVIGVAPGSVFTEIERPVALQLALFNFMGAAVVMYGLHLKNEKIGNNLELYGALSMFMTLGWYCYTVLHQQMLANTTNGFVAVEMFTLATLHRSVQILRKNYAEWRGNPLTAARMTEQLNPQLRPPIEPDLIVEPPRRSRHGR